MSHKNKSLSVLGALILMLLVMPLRAENVQDFGDYVVHYNALTTDMIPASVAKQYDLQRSKNRAMLNLVVLKKVLGASGQPVAADVEGYSTTLATSQRNIDFREIRESNAIYYIADFLVDNEVRMSFHIDVTPEGESETLNVNFRKQFFTE